MQDVVRADPAHGSKRSFLGVVMDCKAISRKQCSKSDSDVNIEYWLGSSFSLPLWHLLYLTSATTAGSGAFTAAIPAVSGTLP